MKLFACLLLPLSLVVATQQATRPLRPDPSNDCTDCAAWNAPRAPSRLFANTYYVGTTGLVRTSSHRTPATCSWMAACRSRPPASTRAFVRSGFRTEDVKLILNSHAHFDHAGGIAALQRVSGATVAASAPGKTALERGMPTDDDPQVAFGPRFHAFPAVKVQAVRDGEVLRVGA